MRGFIWFECLFNEFYIIIMIVLKVYERSFLKKEYIIKNYILVNVMIEV